MYSCRIPALWSKVVTIRTTSGNVKTFIILSADCLYVLLIIFKIQSDYTEALFYVLITFLKSWRKSKGANKKLYSHKKVKGLNTNKPPKDVTAKINTRLKLVRGVEAKRRKTRPLFAQTPIIGWSSQESSSVFKLLKGRNSRMKRMPLWISVMWSSNWFLACSSNWVKSTASFARCIRPIYLQELTRLPQRGTLWKFTLVMFSKICQLFSSFIEIGQILQALYMTTYVVVRYSAGYETSAGSTTELQRQRKQLRIWCSVVSQWHMQLTDTSRFYAVTGFVLYSMGMQHDYSKYKHAIIKFNINR